VSRSLRSPLPVSPTPGIPTPFDAQAAEFDRRVGLPEADCRAIAATVLALGQSRAGDRVVEIGAGTGMIGRWFVDHPVRYVGIDLSRGMLEVFRRRARACLIQADAAQLWPLPDSAARIVFSSRAIHLLPPEHVVAEVLRVSSPGATCVLGWVERRPDSIKSRMSREMQRRLRERGFAVRSAGGRRVLEALLGRRGSDLDTPPPGRPRGRGGAASIRTVAARWPARHTPRQSLDDWSSKEGLGGLVLPPGTQDEVLRELAAWAEETFGGLDAALESEEEYVLESVHLPG
jgi:SAM-dependent methyltransferase